MPASAFTAGSNTFEYKSEMREYLAMMFFLAPSPRHGENRGGLRSSFTVDFSEECATKQYLISVQLKDHPCNVHRRPGTKFFKLTGPGANHKYESMSSLPPAKGNECPGRVA